MISRGSLADRRSRWRARRRLGLADINLLRRLATANPKVHQ
jgi:hypothetical protein